MKESRGHFIPDLPDFDKNQVGEPSRDSVTGALDFGVVVRAPPGQMTSISTLTCTPSL